MKGVERTHSDLVLPRFSHALLVLGGATGLEEIMQQEDAAFSGKGPEVSECVPSVCVPSGCVPSGFVSSGCVRCDVALLPDVPA